VRPRANQRRRFIRSAPVIAVALVAGLLAGCGSSNSSSSTPASSAPHSGGSLTVLEGSSFAGSWPGLDPATDTDGAANQSYMDAIFGQLYQLGQGGKWIPDLATNISATNGGKTWVFTLRQGVKFTDGTPFNAQAVAYNWARDLKSTCTCKPTFLAPPKITVTGPYTIELALPYVDAPLLADMQDDIFDWIASPTAVQTMGETAFALKPVGAGPFTVVSDSPSSELVLKANPHYWQKGLPYLKSLTFKPVLDDETALKDLQSGAGQAYEGMSTPSLAPAFKAHFTTTTEPSTSPYDIQLNTKVAPFNNILAREAIYYATNTPLLDQKLFGNAYPVTQSFTAQAGLFYEPTVPGYITYNLAKAKALVKQLGGISITLKTITSPVAQTLDEGLAEMWEAAGMKVTLQNYDLTGLISVFLSGKWQAFLQTAGAWDPEGGVGVAFRFSSFSPFTGVHDPKVNALLAEAGGTLSMAQRQQFNEQLNAYIAKEAYGPFLFPIAGYNIAEHGVAGPGLTTPIPSMAVLPEVLWQYIYNDNNAK
jgi:peptide/nickel transport system substrate-binding protein